MKLKEAARHQAGKVNSKNDSRFYTAVITTEKQEIGLQQPTIAYKTESANLH